MISGEFVFPGKPARQRMWRLWITTSEVSDMKKLRNIHPGEVLKEEFLDPFGISQNRLAREVSVPPRRINEIVLGKRGVSADTAVRLARYFGTSESFWMGLQADYDVEEAKRALGKALIDEVGRLAA
jgi:addiction module HigA family antidote